MLEKQPSALQASYGYIRKEITPDMTIRFCLDLTQRFLFDEHFIQCVPCLQHARIKTYQTSDNKRLQKLLQQAIEVKFIN